MLTNQPSGNLTEKCQKKKYGKHLPKNPKLQINQSVHKLCSRFCELPVENVAGKEIEHVLQQQVKRV